MSAPLDLDAIRREHEPMKRIAWPIEGCATCQYQDWPCDASLLADEVERLRATNEQHDREQRAAALREAADGIDALHPDEAPKASATWLRERADRIEQP